MAAEKEARSAFVRAMEPVRGKRFLTVRKTRNPIARAIGSKTKRFFSEFKVDSGYCVMWAFKDADGGKPVEEYRFMGTSITADVMMDWAEELNVSEPEYRACLVVKGSDLKREDGRQLPGELYVFAKDSGLVLQAKQAVLALARSAKPPDAACVYGKIMAEKFNLRTAEVVNFKLDREDALMITRACSRLVALTAVIPGIFSTEAMRANPNAALELLRTPPSTDADEDNETIALTGRALLESLTRLRSRPIPAGVFLVFSTQAEKCRFRFENLTGGHSGQLGDSEDFALVVIDFLRDIGSQDAVNVLREITRAVKHVVFEIRGIVSLLDTVDALGPLLVENFRKPNARELGWFFAATCSRNRDRIFNKALSGGSSPAASPVAPLPSILKRKRSSSTNGNGQSTLASPVQSTETSSARDLSEISAVIRDDDHPEATNQQNHEESEVAEEATYVLPEYTPIKEQTATANVAASAAPSVAVSVDADDFENIQEEIDALTRLYEYLRGRLRDEPNHPNAEFWRKEMDACQAEITALGPTMLFVVSRNDAAAPINLERERIADVSSNAVIHTEDKADEGPNFVERALSLWAESRKEALAGSKDLLDESAVVLKNTLEDVRSLAENVDQFPSVAKADKQSREAALAVVGLLEENVSLRLKLVGKGGVNDHSAADSNTVLGELETSVTKSRESPNPKGASDGVDVGEEEYEI